MLPEPFLLLWRDKSCGLKVVMLITLEKDRVRLYVLRSRVIELTSGRLVSKKTPLAIMPLTGMTGLPAGSARAAAVSSKIVLDSSTARVGIALN